ncbi:hypothetical protein AVEN_142227-1 [Araneus ventricosus]|uniref:Uncharacterized protein n=1 Tax=Araneus ventricosus TaxID=182803 RepID=A0A4Y2HR21_ARAVE|nr:hypothetical protein AVEN_142227-1 [Araneus ventricosus]
MGEEHELQRRCERVKFNLQSEFLVSIQVVKAVTNFLFVLRKVDQLKTDITMEERIDIILLAGAVLTYACHLQVEWDVAHAPNREVALVYLAEMS